MAARPPPRLRRPLAAGEEREEMSKLRQTIARRLVEAQHATASLTTFNEVDMSAVMALREKYKEAFEKQYGIGLGFMSFFAKAVMYAFKAVPQVNWTLDGNTIIKRQGGEPGHRGVDREGADGAGGAECAGFVDGADRERRSSGWRSRRGTARSRWTT